MPNEVPTANTDVIGVSACNCYVAVEGLTSSLCSTSRTPARRSLSRGQLIYENRCKIVDFILN